MRINKKIRNAVRSNRFNPLEEEFNFRLNRIFKEVGSQLRNSKEKNNVKLIKEKYCGPKAQKVNPYKWEESKKSKKN